MTPNEYQKAALRTESKPEEFSQFVYSRILQGLMGLNGEAGECIDMLKKRIFQGHHLSKHDLALELGDVAWYLAISADALGYNLEEIFEMNIKKLKARYPDGFDADLSVYRKPDDI